MKKKNKEINIFSVSFLDLLSGALAAVIILFIIVPKMDATSKEALDAMDDLQLQADDLASMVEQLANSVDRSLYNAIQQKMGNLQSALAEAREAVQELMHQNELLTTENEQLKSKIGDLEAQIEALNEAVRQAQAEAEEAKRLASQLQQTVVRMTPRHLDLLIVIDITASMGEALNGLKSEINNVIKVLEHISPSLGIGIIAYGDIEYNQPITEFSLVDVSVSNNRQRLNQFIAGMHLEMGMGSGNNPRIAEALHLAMERALRTQWRPQAEEFQIVVFTDAPAYPDQKENVYNMVRTFTSGGGKRSLSAVQVMDQRVYSETKEMLQKMVEIGNGNYVDISTGGSFLTSLLLAVLEGS